MARELRTLLDAVTQLPLLELVKNEAVLVIYEADNMDRQISLPVAAISGLIQLLDELK